jgi:hypothetical protein
MRRKNPAHKKVTRRFEDTLSRIALAGFVAVKYTRKVAAYVAITPLLPQVLGLAGDCHTYL